MTSSIPMAGGDSTATVQKIQSLLLLVREVSRTPFTGFKGRFKNDCTDLSRRVALLSHLLEEIWDFQCNRGPLHTACSSLSFRCSISQLTTALTAAERLLHGSFDRVISPKRVDFTSQFLSVTNKVETALAYFPYDDFEISNDVKEQVNLARHQLKRAAQQYGVKSKHTNENLPLKTSDGLEDPVIAVDFFCPISMKVFTDPVMVSTGQTYERSYIQRWIDSGKTTCPITRQQLKTPLTLTTNYVLRNLKADWWTKKIENMEEQTAEVSKTPSLPKRNIGDTIILIVYGVLFLYIFCLFLFGISLLPIWGVN